MAITGWDEDTPLKNTRTGIADQKGFMRVIYGAEEIQAKTDPRWTE